MADSILYHIFSPSFLSFLQLAVILFHVNKSFCYTPAEVYRYVEEDPAPDFVLCRQCGGDVADSHYITNQLSPEAYIRSNKTLFGRREIDVQTLLNPLGIQFRVITTAIAKCISIGENWHHEYSWFPGYAWKLCFCSRCGTHVGWMFEPTKTATADRTTPSKYGFYTLILDNVISEACTFEFAFGNSKVLEIKLVDEMTEVPLTSEEEAFIKECEEEFKDRFTDQDEQFTKIHESELRTPPIIDPWYNKPRRNYDWNHSNRNHANKRNQNLERRGSNRYMSRSNRPY